MCLSIYLRDNSSIVWYITINFLWKQDKIKNADEFTNSCAKLRELEIVGKGRWPWTNQTHISRSGHSLMMNICEKAKDTSIVTTEGEYETIPKLSNGTIFSDLQWPLTHISRSRKYLTSNNSTYSKSCMICPMVPFPVTLSDPWTCLNALEALIATMRYINWHLLLHLT